MKCSKCQFEIPEAKTKLKLVESLKEVMAHYTFSGTVTRGK
jgi:hypothetical protein